MTKGQQIKESLPGIRGVHQHWPAQERGCCIDWSQHGIPLSPQHDLFCNSVTAHSLHYRYLWTSLLTQSLSLARV